MEINRSSSDAKASLGELEKKGLLATASVVVPEIAAVAAAAAAGVGTRGRSVANNINGQQGGAVMSSVNRGQCKQGLHDGVPSGSMSGNLTPPTGIHSGLGSSGSSQAPMIQMSSMSMPSLMYQLSHHHPSSMNQSGMSQIPGLKQNSQHDVQQSPQDDLLGVVTNGNNVGLPLFSTSSSIQSIQAIQLNDGEHLNSQGQLIGRSGKPLRNTKRAAQNRSAQKAFRQRREKYIKDLETKAKHYDRLEQDLFNLRRENEELRMRLTDFEKLA